MAWRGECFWVVQRFQHRLWDRNDECVRFGRVPVQAVVTLKAKISEYIDNSPFLKEMEPENAIVKS